MGLMATTWPNVTLDVQSNVLIINNKLLNKRYEYSVDEIEGIDVVKWLPLIAQGIRIRLTKVHPRKKIYFWCANLRKLTDALREFGWLNDLPGSA